MWSKQCWAQQRVELGSGLFLLPVCQTQRSKPCVRAAAELGDTVTIKPYNKALALAPFTYTSLKLGARLFIAPLLRTLCGVKCACSRNWFSIICSPQSNFKFKMRAGAIHLSRIASLIHSLSLYMADKTTQIWCWIFHTRSLESIYNFIPVFFLQLSYSILLNSLWNINLDDWACW